jgi:hypothetical protein
VDEGSAYAKRQSYRDELGTIGKQAEKVAKLNNTPILGNWATPFFNTIWTAGLRQAEKTPVGLAMNTAPTRIDKYYDAIVGGSIVVALGNYAANGGVTGSGPSDPKERELLQKEGWQPYSTLVTNPITGEKHYVPNRMLTLFETPLNVAGELHDAMAYRKPDMDARANFTDAATRMGKVLRQNPYALSGLVAILDLPQFGVAPAVSDQLTRFTPLAATARTAGQAADTMERTTDRGKDVPITEEVIQRWKLGTGQRGGLPTAQDAFGQERRNQRPGALSLLPNMPKATTDRIVDAFQGARVTIGNPPDEITEDGAKIALTQNESRRWDALRGEQVLTQAQRLVESGLLDRLPMEKRAERLESIKATAADRATMMLRREVGAQEWLRRRRDAQTKAKAG